MLVVLLVILLMSSFAGGRLGIDDGYGLFLRGILALETLVVAVIILIGQFAS